MRSAAPPLLPEAASTGEIARFLSILKPFFSFRRRKKDKKKEGQEKRRRKEKNS